jgi:hypothetical protein
MRQEVPAVPADLVAEIGRLRQDLAAVQEDCESATRRHSQPGNLYFLLRKKWKLTQRLFEAESRLRNLSARPGAARQSG